MPSSSKQKSGADAMSEYHRDRATYHTSTIVQGPRKQFGSWNGNKERKDYYRFAHQQTDGKYQAEGHTSEKKKWYSIGDS